MKKILSNCPISCFADEISVSLDRQIQVLNELGIKFVEFRSADGTGVADFTDEQAKEAKNVLTLLESVYQQSVLRLEKSVSMMTLKSI